ncbi:hypothetical protein ASE03_24450 [Kitasatospora sp. Root187]|nr:hypothetical protein ASE03_24450 [Kitasatospora sp. Root187]
MLVAAPAEAATTPSGACGSSYHQIDHHALGSVADVYLFYNGSTNCAVTWVRSPNGTTRYDLRVQIERQSDLVMSPDWGYYYYYAGPVTLYAPNTCISWGGSFEGISWMSGWSHCG